MGPAGYGAVDELGYPLGVADGCPSELDIGDAAAVAELVEFALLGDLLRGGDAAVNLHVEGVGVELLLHDPVLVVFPVDLAESA